MAAPGDPLSGWRGYLRHLCAPQVERSILLALVVLALVLAEPLLLWLLQHAAPDLQARLLGMDPLARRLACGLPPALLLLFGLPWLDWRGVRRAQAAAAAAIPTEPAVVVLLDEADCAVLQDAIAGLRRAIPRLPLDFSIEQHRVPHLWEGRFDPNRWFEVFDRLRLAPGWTLDWSYHHWGNGGAPVLYTRRVEAPRLLQVDAARAAAPRWLEHIEFEPVPVGYWQFLLFLRVAPRFYLHWHALSDDLEYVASRDHLASILDTIPLTLPRQPGGPYPPPGGLDATERAQVLALDLRPRLQLRGRSAEVTFHAWTQFGGLRRQRVQVDWPNRATALAEAETVLAYRSMLRY